MAGRQLAGKIIDRVFVYDDKVRAIALHGNVVIILDGGVVAPDEVIEAISAEIKKGANTSEDACTRSGSDGVRSLTGIIFIPHHIAAQYFSKH